MALSCGVQCLRILLIIFNVIFVIFGIGLIACGSAVIVKSADLDYFSNEATAQGAGSFGIVLGIFVFLLALFGLIGAIKKNRCLLITFTVILGVICLLLFIAMILAFVAYGQWPSFFNDALTTSIRQYDKDYDSNSQQSGEETNANSGDTGNAKKNSTTSGKNYKSITTTDQAITLAWDGLQETFKCCGIKDPVDWQNIANYSAGQYPDSCCKIVTSGCGKKKNPDIWKKGCEDVASPVLETAILGIACFLLFAFLLSVLGIISASCLTNAVGKENYEPTK